MNNKNKYEEENRMIMPIQGKNKQSTKRYYDKPTTREINTTRAKIDNNISYFF